MNKDFLGLYLEKEKYYAEIMAKNLLSDSHILKNPQDVYPEYRFNKSLAFHRPYVNIGSLLFLYRQVVAFVPAIRKTEFPEMFGITYETFVELCKPIDSENEQFILPILNHPQYYDNHLKSELKELLDLQPPTWERWHMVLKITGGDKWFDLADEKINYKNICTIPEYVSHWKSKYPTFNTTEIYNEIEKQVRNNFTNLCLIGNKDKALELSDISNIDPILALSDLMYTSEKFAFSQIMGAGGVANINVDTRRSYSYPGEIKFNYGDRNHVDADFIKVLAEGLKFNEIPRVFRLTFLIKWHEKHYAKFAKDLFGRITSELTRDSPRTNDIYKDLINLTDLLRGFCDETKIHENIDTKTENLNRKNEVLTFSVTSFLGLIGLFSNGLFLYAASTTIGAYGLRDNDTRIRVLKEMWKSHYGTELSPILIDYFVRMYGFKKEYSSKNPIVESEIYKDVNSKDNIYNNLWW